MLSISIVYFASVGHSDAAINKELATENLGGKQIEIWYEIITIKTAIWIP